MKAQAGMMVKAHKGSCIGYIIYESEGYGKVTKVNKKSFKVQMYEIVAKRQGKETGRRTVNYEATYTYWKTLKDGREVYTSPSRINGIVTL